MFALGCGARSELDTGGKASLPLPPPLNIVAGQTHVCWQSKGTLWCWGDNSSGEIGDGTTIDRLLPTMVESGVADIAAADGFTADVHDDGETRWWGSMRQVDSSIVTALTPTTIATAMSRVFARGLGFDMFLSDSTQQMSCWGTNNYTFGIGDPLSVPTVTLEPIACSAFDGAIDMATSQDFSCALWPAGEIKCAGDDSHGQFGDGSSSVMSASPRAVPGIVARAIAVGGAYTCALQEDQTVSCWGVNDNGQLGDGTTVERHTPTLVPGLNNASAVAASIFHTCAIVDGGQMMCWGRNLEGELGDGTMTSRLLPAAVLGITDAVAIALGSYFSCALRSDDTVWCWGENDHGQLGDGTNESHAQPAQIVMPK